MVKRGLSRLGITLLIYVLIAMAVAFLLNIPFYSCVQNAVTSIAEESNHFKAKVDGMAKEFQKYVSQNTVKTTDTNKISDWNNEYWYAYIRINSGKTVFYDTMGYMDNMLDPAHQTDIYNNNMVRKYLIKFEDMDATMEITAFLRARFQNFIDAASVFFLSTVFIVTFLLLLKIKIEYIRNIEEGIKIVESGSLEYRIPVKGKDELASLAMNINQMSSVLSEQLLLQKQIKQKSNDMATSISHDIRTPLTSVICYLDLIADNKYTSQKQLDQYVSNARARAYQIKELTENLFAHFLLKEGAGEANLDSVNVNELVFQILLDTEYMLMEEGFAVKIENTLRTRYRMKVDVSQFCRIIDNICSNIVKYAAKDRFVIFRAEVKNHNLIISETNGIAMPSDDVESFGIGLKNCERILKRCGGKLNILESENEFSIKLSVPVTE